MLEYPEINIDIEMFYNKKRLHISLDFHTH